eukprot:SAG31_NODE_15_length_37942_cov_32.078297_14_plen_144_part_00
MEPKQSSSHSAALCTGVMIETTGYSVAISSCFRRFGGGPTWRCSGAPCRPWHSPAGPGITTARVQYKTKMKILRVLPDCQLQCATASLHAPANISSCCAPRAVYMTSFVTVLHRVQTNPLNSKPDGQRSGQRIAAAAAASSLH